jgi:hypothetical protein
MLREGQAWQSQEIQRLLQDKFGVEYSPNYLDTFLRNLGLSYGRVRPGATHSSESPEADGIEEGWIVDGERRIDFVEGEADGRELIFNSYLSSIEQPTGHRMCTGAATTTQTATTAFCSPGRTNGETYHD